MLERETEACKYTSAQTKIQTRHSLSCTSPHSPSLGQEKASLGGSVSTLKQKAL